MVYILLIWCPKLLVRLRDYMAIINEESKENRMNCTVNFLVRHHTKCNQLIVVYLPPRGNRFNGDCSVGSKVLQSEGSAVRK